MRRHLTILTLAVSACAGPAPDAAQLRDEPVAEAAPEPALPVYDVADVDALIAAIGSRRVVRIAPGDYVIDDARIPPDARHVDRIMIGVVIRDVEQLHLVAADPAQPPRLLERDVYDFVLALADSEHVTLRGLVLGHTDRGPCNAGVLHVERARHVTIEDSELFGSGTVGLTLDDTADVVVRDTAIHHCTRRALAIDESRRVALDGLRIVDNIGTSSVIAVRESRDVVFAGCELADNRGAATFWTGESAPVVVRDTTIVNNDTEVLAAGEVEALVFEDTRIGDNAFAAPE